MLDVYQRIAARRKIGFNGEAPLDWQDFDSYARTTGDELTEWEWGVIGRIDDAYFAAKPKPKDR